MYKVSCIFGGGYSETLLYRPDKVVAELCRSIGRTKVKPFSCIESITEDNTLYILYIHVKTEPVDKLNISVKINIAVFYESREVQRLNDDLLYYAVKSTDKTCSIVCREILIYI